MLRRFFLVLFLGVVDRASQPAFKGYELYSWRAGSEFRYALVLGTNRNQSWSEILRAGIDRAALETSLRKLAVGESVFWFHPREMPLDYPPDKAALQKLCEGLNIQLSLP